MPTVWDFKIGDVSLSRFEVPDKFKLGHESSIVIHKYIGRDGKSKITSTRLGIYPVPTGWTGVFYGNTALSRFQQLDQLHLQMRPTTFTCGPLQYAVEIKKFTGELRHQLEIEYEIELDVLASLNQGQAPSVSNPDFVATTQSLYDSGTNSYLLLKQKIDAATAATVEYQALVVAMDALQSVVNASKPLSSQTVSQLQKVVAYTQQAVATIRPFVDILQASRMTSGLAATLTTGLNILGSIGGFSQNMQTILGQGAVGLSNFSIIVEAGTNLFQIAAYYYPKSEINAAVQLLQVANGLGQAFIKTRTTLQIPPLFSPQPTI